MVKICKKCGETKAFKFFNRLKTSKDGYQYRCKECAKKFNKEYSKKTNYWKNHYKDNLSTYREQNKKNKDKQPKGVYLVKASNGTYIGETRYLNTRECYHRNPNNKLSPVEKVIEFKVLEYIKDETKRKERELYWIKKLNPSLNTLLKS